MTTTGDLIIFCDGGARGNPGPAASAYVATDASGKVVHSQGEYLGDATNNVAEYRALVMALEWLTQRPAQGEANFEKATIKLDSELVVKQTNGLYKIKSPSISGLAAQVKNLKVGLGGKVSFVHIPRAQNFLADTLVNKTLDQNV
ncbi:MAG: ribonuclease HI family protein [bacterium]|nr:ribonuclease HI family protein [bacterium]